MLKPPGNAVNTVARLQQRIACNQSDTHAFPDFVLQVIDPRADDTVLDIGPGLGAQQIPVSARASSVIGLDVSPEMVAALRPRIGRATASAVVGDMDDLAELELGGPFTLVYAVYSLYYSRDPRRVVGMIADRLGGPRPRFVCVCPDVGNNQNWFVDLSRLYELPADAVDVPNLCRRLILPACREVFRTVTCTTYQDRVRFSTLGALLAYYDACAPYSRADKRDEVRRYFHATFEGAGGYDIVKRSVALVGTP